MSSGRVQAFNWGTLNYSQAAGYVTGGDWQEKSPVKVHKGIGGIAILRGGLWEGTIEVEGLATKDTKALLQAALRSSYPDGLPAALYVAAGDDQAYLQDAGSAYINEMEVSLEQGKELNFTLSIMSKDGQRIGTAIAPSPLTGSNTFEWGDASVTIGGAAAKVHKITISLKNNLEAITDLDAKTTGKRKPTKIVSGDQEVECEIECEADLALDMDADSMYANVNIVLTCSDAAAPPATTTITFTLSDFMPESMEGGGFDPEGNPILRKYKFIGKPNSATAIAIT